MGGTGLEPVTASYRQGFEQGRAHATHDPGGFQLPDGLGRVHDRLQPRDRLAPVGHLEPLARAERRG